MAKQPRVHLASPSQLGRLFQADTVNELIVGDSALVAAPMLEALVFYAYREGLARLDFWGRAAPFYADRALELLKAEPRAPAIRAFARFEPVDLMEDAATMLERAIAPWAVLDAGEALETRMIAALKGEADVCAIT